MTLLEEIHKQPPLVRTIMYWLAVATTLGVIGFFWLSTVQKEMFFAVHPDSADRQEFLAQREEHMPQPLATITKALGSLTASIGSLLGFDSSKGFDRSAQHDTVYLLPLSK